MYSLNQNVQISIHPSYIIDIYRQLHLQIRNDSRLFKKRTLFGFYHPAIYMTYIVKSFTKPKLDPPPPLPPPKKPNALTNLSMFCMSPLFKQSQLLKIIKDIRRESIQSCSPRLPAHIAWSQGSLPRS